MNNTDKNKDTTWSQIVACSERIEKQFMAAIRPIYASSPNGNPIHIGTCVLVTHEGQKYLLTAAHILDQFSESILYVGGKQAFVEIEGTFACTNKPDGDRSRDHYDFAWLLLNPSQTEKLGDASFAEVGIDAELPREAEQRFHVALGYPNSTNSKLNMATKSAQPKPMRHTGHLKRNAKLCKKLGISGNEHLFLDYNSKHAKDDFGHIVNAIRPKGMSGGALIQMMDAPHLNHHIGDAPCSGQIAGLLIESHRKHNVIMALRIEIILRQIEVWGRTSKDNPLSDEIR
ncbi:hypothetical protein [Petrachloros mirabilis]